MSTQLTRWNQARELGGLHDEVSVTSPEAPEARPRRIKVGHA